MMAHIALNTISLGVAYSGYFRSIVSVELWKSPETAKQRNHTVESEIERILLVITCLVGTEKPKYSTKNNRNIYF